MPKASDPQTALFDSQVLKKLRYLSLVSRRIGEGTLARPRRSRPAGGTEPFGHRDYAPGDDYRMVDWNVCARHDELLTRVFPPRADEWVYLLLDCSASMGLGDVPKFDAARRAAAALAYAALANLERVRIVAFSDRLAAESPPVRRKAAIAKLLGYLEDLAPRTGQTDLARAAADFVRRYPRRGPAVVLSDLYDPAGFHRGLDVLRRRGYLSRVVHVYDPYEAEPDLVGDWELFDVETGTTRPATLTERHLAGYRRLVSEHREAVRAYCARYAVPRAEIPSDLPPDEIMLRVIRARGARAGGECVGSKPSGAATVIGKRLE